MTGKTIGEACQKKCGIVRQSHAGRTVESQASAVSKKRRVIATRSYVPGTKHQYNAWCNKNKVARAKMHFALHERFWLAPWSLNLKVLLERRGANFELTVE